MSHLPIRGEHIPERTVWLPLPEKRGPSALERGPIEPAEPLRVRQDVDLHDPAVGNGEAKHGEHAPIRTARHDSDASVYEDDLSGEARLRERDGLRRHGAGAPHHARHVRERSGIGPQHDVGIEYGHQTLEVAVAGCRQKGVEYTALLLTIGLCRRRLTLDAPPG